MTPETKLVHDEQSQNEHPGYRKCKVPLCFLLGRNSPGSKSEPNLTGTIVTREIYKDGF